MKCAKFLTGIAAAGALALMLAAPQSGWAKKVSSSDDDTPTTRTIKLFAVGNGTGIDDKTGDSCDTIANPQPNLACIPGDTCGCLSGSAPDFSGEGICKASLTNMQVSFDFAGPVDLNGIPNGTIADPLPLTGRCYGASGFALITTTDTNSDTINLLVQGVFCDAMPGQPHNNASFNGTYIIAGGSGPYAAATGTGSFTASIDNVNTGLNPPPSPMTFSATGSLTALFSEDGPCKGKGDDEDDDSDSNGDAHSHNHHGHGKG